jgi:flagellar motor switch protein FliN/FliY
MNFESSKAKAYLAAWSGSMAQLLSQLGGAAWDCELADAAAETPVASATIRSSKVPGSQTLLLSANALGEMLGLFLGEPAAITQEPDAIQREALEELLRQWCGLAATALKSDFGELSFEVTLDNLVAAPGSNPILLRASSGASAIAIALELDSALQAFLSAAPAPEASAPADAKPQGNTRIEELLRRGNLELLMDVELPVMLRFGCREATLREVLDMATGAVLELDREVHEPVDLVLNGRIIARGEVVVIDGDFGLRVSEVASPQQRVNSFTTA